MPERDFWQTMNPARLIALFDNYFSRRNRRRSVPTVGTRENSEPMGPYSAIMEMGGT
ncbi:MAG: hypothetical protein II008_18190 [Oscillospiraceae bacterium]|nr:hypothetical protein [Oscillospiraceae bacterium]